MSHCEIRVWRLYLAHCVCVFFLTTNISISSSLSKESESSKSPMNRSIEIMDNKAPVIGILSQVLRDHKRFSKERHLHIAASYVKWIESSGAQVVPILLNQDDEYYQKMFNLTNGLLLPGGDNLLDPKRNTPMMVAAKKLYKLAVAANDRGDFYPIWGTCLGLELLSVLTSDGNFLSECQANDMSLTMEFTQRGKLFAPSSSFGIDLGVDYSKLMMDVLTKKNITYNFHHMCLTDDAMKMAGIDNFYRPLSYSYDANGLKFIAIFEAIDYPFYGVQFHPEKHPFEFVVKKSQRQIMHSEESIAASRFFADFFVNQAKLSNHSDPGDKQLKQLYIYNYNPTYTAPKNDMYEQRYLFPFKNNGLSSDEFLDYLPEEGEKAPEYSGLSDKKRQFPLDRIIRGQADLTLSQIKSNIS